MLFGLFMEAYMHDFNLVYITLFFVFSFAFSAGPLGVLNLGNLQTTFSKQGRIFAKEETALRLKVNNPSTTTSWSITLHGQDKEETEIPFVKAEKSINTSLSFIAKERGAFKYEGCYLESKYPLSTARLTKPISDTYEGIVYPQPKGLSLDTLISQQETNLGEEKEFDGLSTYDGTQKLSHLHWASVAKGEMAVKRFTKETKVKNLNFIFNNIKGDTEARLSQLTLWILACEKQKLQFSIQFPQRVLHSHKESIDEILETLARY